MFEKIRQKISKAEIESKSVEDCPSTYSSSDSEAPKADIPTAPLLNLPIDIFSLVTKYLLLADLISLSLTTKSLRHICPSPRVHVLESDTDAELKCFSRIHLRFLPLAPPQEQERSIRNAIFNRTSSLKCPYCSRPLCSPGCESALFLDTTTGVFFPRSLYNISKAAFKYSPEYISTNPHGHAPSIYKLLSMEGGYKPDRSAEPFVYSTIWCNHHRCPRGLLIPNSKSDRRSVGAKLFLEEYMQQWGELRFLLRVKSPYSTASWSIWAQDLVGYELTMQPIRGGAEYGTKPVYEYAFYETICRHCGLVCKDARMGSTVFETVCRCGVHTSDLGLGGCRRCGLVSVKFEVVEAFGGDGRKLAVATEWKEGVRKRLEPISPGKRAKQLEIVRGRNLIETPVKGRIGILDLPAGVLKTIMEFVALQSEDSEGEPFEMLTACYSFARAWYELDFYGCCRRFELLEAIMNEKRQRGKGNQGR
ncbi:hypothetical protein TWF481_006592 [Arthrobotrys musiformis]|uniref:F-box domain-containing protein n=1 Tax=Arthrobotrys musiformis TaxID=47236 RepID=A0AAV9W908_9PEZI